MNTAQLTGLVSEQEMVAFQRFVEMLRARFGARLREVRLFGSTARGERHEDSDIDVAVMIDDLTWEERREVHGWPGDILLETWVYLSPVVFSTAEFAELLDRERRIALDIRQEGIPLEP